MKWGTQPSPGTLEADQRWRAQANCRRLKWRRRRGRLCSMTAAGFTSAFPPARNHGYSASSSTAGAETWGLDPILIFRSRRRAEGPQSTASNVTMEIDPLDAKAAQRQAQR